MPTTQADTINADLLAFIKGEASRRPPKYDFGGRTRLSGGDGPD